MTESNKKLVGKGAVYIYIESIISAITGYGLWLLLTKITTSAVVGTTSTVITLASIFTTIVAIGIPNSIPRFLGKSFSEQHLEDAKVFVKASLFLVSIGITVGTVIILLIKDYWILHSLDFSLILISIALMASEALALLLRYIIIASLKTKALVGREIIFSTAKIVLSVTLILMGAGAAGLTLGYTIGQILVTILLAYVLLSILKSSTTNKAAVGFLYSTTNKAAVGFLYGCKSILIAGIPSWIPALITTIGTQLGTIIVFQTAGASSAGAYFIALSIVTGITAITYSLLSATFPALSAMRDGRKRFAWQLTKLSLLFSLPLSSAAIFYSREIMALFGQDYINGSPSLQILLLSVLPATLTTGINILIYSYGNYRQVLIIGLASSIPRTILYFALVPIYGSNGSAISFTIGSIIGSIACIVICRKIGMLIFWKDLIYMFMIPTALGYVLSHFAVNYIIGIVLAVVISYVLLLKLQVLNRLDVQDSFGILPPQISTPLINVLNRLGERLNRAY
jgi:O-antigen/teichoic acid export membrane protein